MLRFERTLAALIILIAVAAPASAAANGAPLPAARLLLFSAASVDGQNVLLANRTPIMRIAARQMSLPALSEIADSLNRLAHRGVTAKEIEAKAGQPAGQVAQIMAAGKPLLSVEAKLAASGKLTALALAQSWARNLKDALSTPYLTIYPIDRLQVPLGEKRPIRWGGTATAQLTFTSANPAVAGVQPDPTGRSVLVTGLGVGCTEIVATLDDQQLALEIAVKAWAARTPPEVVAEVTFPPLPSDDLRRTVRNAVLAATKPAPGATVELGEPQRRGEDYVLQLRASGKDCLAVDDTIRVSLKTVTAPRLRAREMLISNSPERITEPATLLRERLVGGSPVRLLWHHVNSNRRPLRFVVRVANLGTEETRVHLTDAATGPHDDEIFVGHSAMTRFLALSAQGEGYFLKVPAGRMLDLYDVKLTPDRIVSGLATITPTAGSSLMLEVTAEDTWPTDAWFQAVPARLAGDPPLTPYRFEAAKTVELEHAAGGAWTFYHIGKDYSVNLQGEKLFGDYGVEYTIRASFKNPTAKPARCEIGLRAAGGVARSTLVIDGVLTETGLLRGANEQLIYKTELQPGAQRSVSLLTIPKSGSNYPITLTMRSWQ